MLVAVLAVLALGCLAAPAAFAAPNFTWIPTSPVACQEVTFMPSDVEGQNFSWEHDGSPPDSNPTTFTTEGTHAVTMDLTTGPSVTHNVVVANAPPVASFDYSPAQPYPGEWIVFQSTSTDCDDSVVTTTWDFHDGTTSPDPNPVHRFATAGLHDVTLTVTDQNGATGTKTIVVPVFRANAPPVAGFVWTPTSPVAGSQVQLFSTSADAEGAVSEAWELDFDDALGPSATASFGAGDHQVSLRVTDGDGVSRVITRTITVAAAPVPPAPAAPAAPKLMSPFPTVRLVGVVVARGARITLVEVRGAPRGARVAVRCTGGGCPWRLRRRVVETGRVRLSDFKRVLAAGARIQVFVRAPGVIGKYVGFRIRAGKRPLRTDRCLMPGASEPTRCS
jgi:PKD repeat protein